MKKNFTISFSLNTLLTRIIPLALIFFIVGGGIGLFIIDKLVMPRIVGVDRELVEVPSIVGLNWEQGREALYKTGLLTEVRSREFDDKVAEQAIVNQFPEAGSRVKKGRRIAITISKGKELAVIPDIRNITERQARIELRKKGFVIGKTKKTYSDEHEIDVVIDAFPQTGTTISRSMEIDLIVSKGPKPTHAEVPNMVGESLAEAKKKLEEAGLGIGKIEYHEDASLLPGTIISQSEAPGSSIRLESTINVVVSVIK